MTAIARIKEAASLPLIAAEYVKLRKAGTSLLGLCPFHSERTPSFHVHVEYFKCFGCGAAGDVITFLSRIEGVSPGRAIAILSDRTGIPLDPQAPPRTRLQRLYDADEQAFAEWWWERQKQSLAFAVSVSSVDSCYEGWSASLRHVSDFTFTELGFTQPADGPMYEPSGGPLWSRAEAAGVLWRQFTAVPRHQLRALAERCATAEDRREWEYLRASKRAMEGAINA